MYEFSHYKSHYPGNSLTITVNDLTVSYIDEGQTNSPTIIFIHGFPLNKLMWEKQIELLRENYRVIAYDIHGHGNTVEKAFEVICESCNISPD